MDGGMDGWMDGVSRGYLHEIYSVLVPVHTFDHHIALTY